MNEGLKTMSGIRLLFSPDLPLALRVQTAAVLIVVLLLCAFCTYAWWPTLTERRALARRCRAWVRLGFRNTPRPQTENGARARAADSTAAAPVATVVTLQSNAEGTRHVGRWPAAYRGAAVVSIEDAHR